LAKDQFVILKGNKSGISIWLDENAGFEIICEQLRQKVSGAKRFFADANVNMAFKGRTLSDEEEKALLDIIIEETTLELEFVESEGFDAPPPPAPADTNTPSNAVYTEYMTAYYHNGLRSGQSIRYAGSVVVMGDANPGSEIIADGNVVVLGSLKGLVHAGASGDDRCYISALSLTPTQLRISNIITYLPAQGKDKQRKPAYAYVQAGQVYIAPLWD
jgi:septum site-determining protein MinC